MAKFINRFGENKNDKWYELTDGKRIPCDESYIDSLWHQWVVTSTERYMEGDYVVFEFKEPILILGEDVKIVDRNGNELDFRKNVETPN